MVDSYKILIADRNYQEWDLYDAVSLVQVQKVPIDPSKDKLFSGDIFEYKSSFHEGCETLPRTNLLHSVARSMTMIPGILVLKGGKTYGKINS